MIEPSSETPRIQDVDDVLSSMVALEGRPVSEHVTVFEEAHDRLRDALARAGDENRPT